MLARPRNPFVGITAVLHGDISLRFSSFNPLMLIYFIFVVMIQSGVACVVVICYGRKKNAEV